MTSAKRSALEIEASCDEAEVTEIGDLLTAQGFNSIAELGMLT